MLFEAGNLSRAVRLRISVSVQFLRLVLFSIHGPARQPTFHQLDELQGNRRCRRGDLQFSGPNSAGGSAQRSSALNGLAFENACLGIDAVEQRPEMFCNHSRALIVKHTVVPAGKSVVQERALDET